MRSSAASCCPVAARFLATAARFLATAARFRATAARFRATAARFRTPVTRSRAIAARCSTTRACRAAGAARWPTAPTHSPGAATRGSNTAAADRVISAVVTLSKRPMFLPPSQGLRRVRRQEVPALPRSRNLSADDVGSRAARASTLTDICRHLNAPLIQLCRPRPHAHATLRSRAPRAARRFPEVRPARLIEETLCICRARCNAATFMGTVLAWRSTVRS
jgi:hypothetical protein